MNPTRPRPAATGGYLACAVLLSAIAGVTGCARLFNKDRDGDARPRPGDGTADPGAPDQTPPPAPTLMPPEREASGDILVRWTQTEGSDAVSHELSLTSTARGCERPLVTYSVSTAPVRLAAALPGGSYVLCLQAFDAAKNGVKATNQGKVALDQPVDLQYAVLRGVGPESRTLVHGRLKAATPDAEARETVVAAPGAGLRISGLASLQLDETGEPRLALIGVADGLTEDAGFAVMDAKPKGKDFALQTILRLSRLENAAAQGTFTLSGDGESYLTLIAKAAGQGGGQLLYTEVNRGESAAGVTIERTESAAVFQDATMVVDDRGQIHIVYVQDGQLTSRLKTATGWGAPVKLDAPGCSRIEQIAVAAGGGRIAVAYTCTRGSDDESACALGLTGTTADRPTAWRSSASVVIDAYDACLPFASARPTVVMDEGGKAHVAARTEGEHGPTVAYAAEAEPGAGIVPLADISGADPLAGFPKLALDATGSLYCLYLTSRGLEMAVPDSHSGFRTMAIGLGTEAARGSILELADVAIAGGRGRSNLRFGDWVR